jgi:hypothetical protein
MTMMFELRVLNCSDVNLCHVDVLCRVSIPLTSFQLHNFINLPMEYTSNYPCNPPVEAGPWPYDDVDLILVFLNGAAVQTR